MIATELRNVVNQARVGPTAGAERRVDVAPPPMPVLVDRLLSPAFRSDLTVDLVGSLRQAGLKPGDEAVAGLQRVPFHLSDAELIARARLSDAADKVW